MMAGNQTTRVNSGSRPRFRPESTDQRSLRLQQYSPAIYSSRRIYSARRKLIGEIEEDPVRYKLKRESGRGLTDEIKLQSTKVS